MIVLFPGSFKPLTGGHLSLIKRCVANLDVKEVKIFVGPEVRDGVTQSVAISVISELLKDIPKVTIQKIKNSPITTAYKFIETAEPGIYALASSKKDNDYKRTNNFVKYHSKGERYYNRIPKDVKVVELYIDVNPSLYSGRSDENEGTPISGVILREDIKNNNFENFKTNYPDCSDETIIKIWNLLKKK